MNPIEWIKNKLKKKEYDIGIMKFGDKIVIPGRDYFNNPEKIKILEEYKKHYLKELKRKRVITTLSFNSNKLKQDLNMNVDLTLRILMDNDDFYNYAYEELMIQSLKLEMYKAEIDALENETILRLVALKEIELYEEVPKRNLNALKEEIIQLKTILDMYSYKKGAVNLEIDNYKEALKIKAETESIMNKIIDKEVIESNDELFKQRLDNLLFMSDEIYDKKELDNYDDIKLKIAILERECERYTYLNKDEAPKIKEDLEFLSKKEVDEKNKEELLEKCAKLERKLLLFYHYSKKSLNLISEDDLRKFYEFKFKVLTKGIYSLEKSPINKSDYGLPYYLEIIENKLNDAIQFESNCAIPESLKYFIKYYKNDNNIFDFEEILLNKYKLSFLLTFDNCELPINIYNVTFYYVGIIIFFNQTNISLNEETLKEFGDESAQIPGITWAKKIPLASYFELMSDDNHHPLIFFYKTYAKETTNLLVPEGVESVYFNDRNHPAYDRIKKELEPLEEVKCPKSLKILGGDITFENPKDLTLNYGLDIITSSTFSNIKTLTIPSTLRKLSYPDFVRFQNIQTIVFDDFENSLILNDEKEFMRFIRSITEDIDTKKVEIHRPSQRSLEIQKKYKTGRFTTSDHAALFDHEYVMHVHKLVPIPSVIVFKSQNDGLSIGRNSLISHYNKPDSYSYYREPSYDKIYKKIRNAILYHYHFDISHKENDDNHILEKSINNFETH